MVDAEENKNDEEPREGATESPEEPEKEVVEQPKPEPESKTVEDPAKRAEELLTRLKYLQAEFENYQKRAFKEKQEVIETAQVGLLLSLLPVLDDLDKAVETAGKEGKGITMVRTKLLKVLGESGLKEIPAKDMKFDPFLHEAVEYTNDESMEEGAIKEVVRKGYRCDMKVLRPSLVVVVKNEGEKNA